MSFRNIFTSSFLMRFLILALPVIFFSLSIDALAASATGRATAEIIRPLYVKTRSPLSFGELEWSPHYHGGKVTVTPWDTRRISGSIRMERGGYEPASFHVFGSPNFTYTVITPDELTFHVRGHHHDHDDWRDKKKRSRWNDEDTSLQVVDFTTFSKNLRATGHRGHLGNSGKDTLFVGGTLIVSRNAAPGLYKGYVPIEVAYQ